MQRQPLAEQAAGLKPGLHGRKVFKGVQTACTASGRMEKIGHDHIVAIGRGLNVAARVGSDGRHGTGRSRRTHFQSEDAGCINDLRQQFDSLYLDAGVKSRSAGGVTRTKTEKQCCSRRRMEQQGQLRQTGLYQTAGTAAFLNAVVDVQSRNAVCVFDHTNSSHHPFTVTEQTPSGRYVHKP